MHDHGHTFSLPHPVLYDFDSVRQRVLLNDAANQNHLLGFKTILIKKI